MKKALILLAFVLSLVACTKPQLELGAHQAQAKSTFFSRVQYFKDGRTPGTDTTWTLTMLNQTMIDSFARYNGKVYWESSTVKEVGVLWTR
jgi:hypothetical protein